MSRRRRTLTQRAHAIFQFIEAQPSPFPKSQLQHENMMLHANGCNTLIIVDRERLRTLVRYGEGVRHPRIPDEVGHSRLDPLACVDNVGM